MKTAGSLIAVTLALTAFAAPAQDVFLLAGPKRPVRVDQKLNQKIPVGLRFRDEHAAEVTLGDYFGRKPVILNLVYFDCPMLCNVVTDAMVNSLTNLKFDIGSEYTVLTVSFDPRDTSVEAAEWKRRYVKRYGRRGAAEGWHFLTGNEESIRQLTDAVGFRFYFDPKIKQYAHGATLVVLTPEARISRYLYGIEFAPRDVQLSLVEASQNKIGSLSDRVLLLCYHYDPATGKYSVQAMNAVRAGGIVTVVGLAGFILVLARKGRVTEKKP